MVKLLGKPVWIFYILVSYVTIQFSWWLYLIYDLSTQLYPERTVRPKLLMVIGEGLVFLSIMILGVFLIRRGLKREKKVMEIQENFLLSISHELKTPIAATKLNLQTLQRPNTPVEKEKEILRNALTSTARLEKLVNNLLLAKSVRSKNYFTNKKEIELCDFLNRIVKFQFSAVKNRIALKLPQSQLCLANDEDGLESIVVNLIDNAIKYSEDLVDVLLKNEEDCIEIEVIDRGRGIPEHELFMVTKKFYRVENEITRTSKGTGLGLFLVKELAKNMNAEFTIKNRKPNGLSALIRFENS